MSSQTTIFIGADHAGVGLKKTLLEKLVPEFPQFKFEDLGPQTEESVDYPDFAEKVGRGVAENNARGILVCGSGIGMAISANKIKGVRAASVWDATSARLCREHNAANVICLGARLTGVEVALESCRVWLKTEFQGGRHQKRIDRISQLEAHK